MSWIHWRNNGNIISQKYGVNSTLYSVAMKGFPLSSHMFFCTPPFFDVTKRPTATSVYLSISTSEPGTKYEIYGVMLQVAHESKIQLVGCEISPKYLLGLSTLEYIRAIEVKFSVTRFVLYYCLRTYLFLLNCTQNVLSYLCSSEISFLYFPV